jgi:predicted Zn-dependent protease
MKKFILFIFLISYILNIYGQNNIENRNDLTYLYIEAVKNKTFGNYSHAGYLFSKYNKIDSSCIACLFELSKISFNSGDINSALYYAVKAYTADTLNYWYIENYAQLLLEYGRSKDAIIIYKKIEKYFGKNFEDQFNLASLYLKANYPNEGFKILDSLERLKGISNKIETEKYNYFISIRKYDDALKILIRLLKEFPENIYLNGLIADIYVLKKDFKSARLYYKIYLATDATNVNANLSYSKFLLQINDTLNGYRTLENIFENDSIENNKKINIVRNLIIESKSKSELKNYLDKHIEFIINRMKDSTLNYELACDYYEIHSKFEKCLNYVEILIKRDENNPIHWERAFFYLNILKKYDSICKISPVIIKRFDDRPFIYIIAGVAFQHVNREVIANYYFIEGLKYVEEKSEIKRQLVNLAAESFYKLGKIDSSFYYFEIALNDNETDISVYNNYAYYLALNKQKLIKALELSRLTINKFPKNSSYLDTYAWICFQSGNYKDALKYIELALKYSDKKNVEMFEHYGDILYCNEKKGKALKYWKVAFKDNYEKKEKLMEKIKNVYCK